MTWKILHVPGAAARLSLGVVYVLLTINIGSTTVTANGKIAFFNQTLNSSIVLTNSVLTFNQSDFKKAFSFRTCSTNGQLLHQRGGSGDYFSVSVINGSLDVRWRAGSTEEVLAIGSNLYNNRWYYVNVFTILGSTRLEVNLGSNLLASDVLGNGTYRTSLWRADLRGSGDLTVGSHFTGCIQQGPGVTFENNNAIQSIGVSWSNTSCPIDGVTCNSDDNTQTFCWSSPCRHGGTCREEGDTYSCQCPHLYNGTNCDNYLGVLGCTVSPCLNNGSCVDQNSGSNNYQCNCLPGFNGFNCEVDINECGQNPCNNGGRCIDGINSFTCNCTGTGYQGNTCSVNIDECNPISPCQNGGTCFDTQGSYDCQCPAGYQDKNCQEVNECLSQPCKNGGSCNDQLNAYTCDCVQGFTDPDCNTNIDDCQGVVCPGNFTQCQDGVNMHTCVCKPGYTGVAPVCTEVQECSSNPCKNGASCIDRINRYECQCLQGFNGTNCENNIDNCLPNPCRNNASCQDLVDDYTCSCLPGYTGKNCSQDINECLSNPCSNGATCRNLLNQFQCDCVPGWTGTLCETDIDECSSNPCKNGATCQQSLDHYTCTCQPGFTGDNCETDIDDCSPNPCEHGGSCVDKVNGYECQCTADWMGKNCSVQYNACSFAPCKNGATCMTEPPKHDYNCTCVPGFQDANCSTNIDDCASAPCTAPFVCFDGVNNHTCACPTGYTGVNCSEEIMECESNPCQNGGTCIDQVGNYTCVCLQSITNLTRYVSYPGVFVTGYKGRNCEQDIDECAYPNPICLNGGKCENSDGDYKCYCGGNHGDGSYTLGHNCELSTTYCQVAEEAKLDPPACHNGGNCTAGDDTFTCTCAAGYTGRRCKIDIDECASDPCQYNGTCNDHVAHFTCDCIPGITGETCDTDIDECASNPCKNEGQCKDYINGLEGFDVNTLPPVYTVGYECNCTDTGFNGTTCENNIDDCASNPCQHGSTCTDLIKDYNCTCYLGYTGKNCEMDIDECASSPCQYNGTCLEHSKLDTYTVLNSLGEFSYANASGYSCQCIKGITGANCEINIDDCVNNTCEHGSTCKDLIDDYMCQCAPGYKGDMCEIDIDECELNACKNDATCTDRVADYDCTCSNVKNSQGQLFSGKNCTFELTACYPENNPRCQNGAICHPFLVNEARGEQGYTCECQPGYTGVYCEIPTTGSFDGSRSSVTSSLSQTINNTISFRFRTTLPNVILFVWRGISSSRMFLHLEIVSGRLQMWYVTSNEANVEEFSFTRIPVFVNDSYWHEIRIHQEENILNLTLNSPNCKNSPADTCFRQLTYLPGSPNNKVYFGNVENEFVASNTFSQTRFKGCMEDITVNSNILLPTSTGSDAMAIAVTNGCNRRPQCSADTCNTHGKCYDFWDEFRCDCQRPYIGGSCEEEWKPATFAKDNSISEVRFNISSLQADLRSRVDLSLFIRTREEKGLAVYLGDSGSAVNGTFLTVEIFDGYLASRLVLCNTKWYLWANNTKINDGNKHLVGVVLQNNVHKLLYNNQVVQEKIIQSNANCPFVGQACYFGGEVPASLRQPGRKRRSTTIVIDNLEDLTNVSRYKGTIQDAQLNNNPMPFFPTPQNVSAPGTNVSVEAVSGLVEGEQSDDVCNNTMPCMNNASCTNEFFNDFSCDCPRGYRGKNCSELDFCHNNSCPASATCQSLNDGFECISTANFGVQSAVSFSPNISSGMKIDKISMMIRTIVKNGHLFAISNGNQYIHVQIEGGMVMMECRLDQGVVQTATVDMNIADKRWHKIELTEYQSNITLMVTGPFENKSSLVDRNSNMATFRSLVDKTSELSLGRKSSIFSYHYFKGCIKEPRIGGILLPFYLQSEFTNFTTQEYFEATMISQIAHNCVEGSECGSNQCRHSSTCKPDYYGYTCDCTGTGYEGFWCQNNVNDCQPDSCYNNGVCLDVVNDFRCKCPKPYYGYFTRCQNVTDVCSPDPCQNGATCSPVDGDYTCDCTDTFTGQNCTVQKSGCSANTCHNNGTCNQGQTQADFTCTCPSPYTGPLCDVILDPCNSLPCNNGNCTPGADPGSYNCVCATDYTGLHCETYIDHCNSSPCKNNGSCVDYVGGYNCNCTDSWTGSMCEIDFNECLTQPCQNNGTCQDFTGYYNCDCTGTGYQGILDCATDFDECTLSPCANGGTCYNYDGGYNCTCSLGYTGEHCTVVNCSMVNCNQGQCGRTPNGSQWQCNCNQYYYGKFCNVPGKCASSPCNPNNSLVCTDIDVTNQTYSCSCKLGWEGQNCEVDIDECTRNNPCRNGATCNNTQGSYICHCAPGYTGTNCGTNIDECSSQPCRNRGQCIDQINKFECNCSGTGYQGSTCMDDINECLGSPCLNEGKCVNTNGSYDCDCVPGYIGPTCAVADPSFQKIGEDDNMLWIIVGPVVAGVLLIIVIIIIVFLMMARNKRATRGTYNPSRQEVIGSRVELGNVMKPPPEERLI